MAPTKKTTKKVEKKAPKVEPEEKKLKKTAAKKAVKAEEEADAPAPKPEKQVIIEQFQVKQGDTGSPEVQVALLSNRIDKLISHLKINPSDNHSRRGLLGIVSKRRRLLNYIEKKDALRYAELTQKLGLGK